MYKLELVYKRVQSFLSKYKVNEHELKLIVFYLFLWD